MPRRTPRRRTRFAAHSPSPRYINLYFSPFLRLLTSSTQPSVPGALSVDAVCQEGVFVIENVSFYKDAKLATDLTAEADCKRRGLYIGPQVRFRVFFFRDRRARALKLCLCQFETLDLNLQEEFERFLLQERGIDESLALFVPEYAQYNEQKVRPVRPCGLMVTDRARVLGVCRLAKQSQGLRGCLTDIILAYITTPCKNTSHVS